MNQPKIDPLETVHQIQRVILNGRPIANAMLTLGMSAGEDLHMVLDRIDELAKEAATGIMQETNERYHEAVGSTDRLMGALMVNAMQGGAQ